MCIGQQMIRTGFKVSNTTLKRNHSPQSASLGRFAGMKHAYEAIRAQMTLVRYLEKE
jgi:hypothetical protein